MEIQRYWSVVRKRLWLIVLIAIVGCASAGYYTAHQTKPAYQAVAKLMVYQSETADNTPASPDAGAINSNILLIKTFKQLIMTPRVLNRVAAQYPELHTSAGELAAKISIASVSETQIMSVFARDPSYPRAAKMANAVSKVFQEEVRQLMKLDNVSVIDWADPEEPRAPAAASPIKSVMIVLVLALMIGIGLAFLLDHLDDSVQTERDIRDGLGLALLADVPRIRRRDLTDSGGSGPEPTAARRDVELRSKIPM